MPTIRVYELAKEMDMNSKVLLDTMIELGLPMKNHMSTIPGNEVSRIRAMVLKHLGDPNAEPIPRPAEKKEKPPLSGLKSRPGSRGQEDERGQLSRGQQGQPRPAQGQSRPGMSVTGQPRTAQGQNRPGQGQPGRGQQGQPRPAQGQRAEGYGQGRPVGQAEEARGGQPGAPGAAAAPRRQPGESISPQEAQAQARARRQPGESISPDEAQAQARARRQPGESISPEEAQAQARARRRPGDSISPEEARAQARSLRPEQAPPAAAQAEGGEPSKGIGGEGDKPAAAIEGAAAKDTAAAMGRADREKPAGDRSPGAPVRTSPPRQGQARPGQSQAPYSGQPRPAQGQAGAGQGQAFGQNRGQSVADKFARTPGQAKPQKPRRPQAPADNRQKGFTKGPKAPTISRDTADQLTHLGSATEEDSRFLNKVENAVGERAYDRGGIARTPTRKQNRYDDSRGAGGRGRGRGGRDRGRQIRQEPIPVVIKNITLDGPTTVTDFARLLGKKTGDVIKKLISYGIMANINQELDLDTLILLGQDFGTQVEARITKEEILIAADEPDMPENLHERPPVVTIMGHVDHGKTSLLDAIREANVQASEAGGITQHIGAYQVEVNNRRITFLDTPGHEAFTAMRARGAQCTDIAILVVAADDGVMPQTVEAINHAKAAKVPIIVAVNKVDLEGANPERIKQELTEHGLVTEDWGGDTIFAEVSAKTRQGLDQLLEMILLVADMGDLKANPARKAKGVVIEAKLDKGRGPVATVLVQNGTLESGDFLIAGTAQGRIRAMNDERGRLLKVAGPSTPVEVVGLSEVPQAGDGFQVVEDEKLAKQIASERTAVKREEVIHSRSRISLDDLFAQIQTGEVQDLNIIIKADVQGSIEALKTSLEKLSNDEVRVQTIHQGVGGITEADVDFASASNAIILGFNVRPDVNAKKSAETNQVDIRLYRVIYNAIEDVKSALSGLLKPEIRENVIGKAEVRQVIRVPRMGAIAGCYILEGKITRGCQARVIRDNIVIHESTVDSLRRFKDDVREVATGFECGLGIDRFNDFQENDVVEGFIMEEIKRELA
ncbi:MAG: translation initiation factor IF-2 [Clostridiales bacterium]|nr:translation initiation factor IF-2 [Clostridiales bacterium]